MHACELSVARVILPKDFCFVLAEYRIFQLRFLVFLASHAYQLRRRTGVEERLVNDAIVATGTHI